jgi:hypothetical protein
MRHYLRKSGIRTVSKTRMLTDVTKIKMQVIDNAVDLKLV